MKTELNQTQHIVRAVNNRELWGAWATMRYIQKRGIDIRLYRLARQLDAAWQFAD